jgi:hypothetical protein
MALQVAPHEGANDHHAKRLSSRGVERELGENIGEPAAAECRGHFRVEQPDRVFLPTVLKNGSRAVYSHFELSRRGVVANDWLLSL